MITAATLPAIARDLAAQPSAMEMSRLTAVSSRKSTESAMSETELMVTATPNSTKKYAKLSSATIRTMRRSWPRSMMSLMTG